MGPLFWHEMRRLGRRARLYWLRLAFILALASFYGYSYYTALEQIKSESRFAMVVGGRIYYGNQPTQFDAAYLQSALARMGQEILVKYMTVEALLAMVLCPLLVAGSLAEERRQGTMDLLLTSELSPWEIVAGKMLPRVLLFGLLVFGGGVIMVLAQFQGGIDPLLVALGTAVLLSGMLSQSALTMWLAARGGSPTWVLFMSSLALAAWLLWGWARLPSFLSGLGYFLPWVNAAALLRFLQDAFAFGGSLDYWPVWLTLVHVVVHIGLTGLFLWLAGRALRWGHEQTQTSATPRPGRLSARWSRQRPPMSGRRPLHWKERGASALWSRLLWLVGGGVVVILTTIWGLNASDRGGLLLDDEARRLALLFTLPALLVPMLLTASRAAWSLRGEADRATWDALLATPLQLRDILWAKWQGSVLGVVQPLIILGLVGGWGAAVAGTIARSRFRSYYRGIEVPGWNSLQAIALLLLNCLVAVILAAGVGLLMSVINRSVLRAYVSTFFTLSLYCGLPLLLSYLVFGLMRSWGASALVVLLDIFESSIYLGLPLMLVLSLGFLSARLRRGMGLVLRVVAVPVLIVLVLQVPMILLGTFLVIATMKSRGGDILLLLSPPGFVLDLVDRWLSVGVYYRGLQSFMFESEAEVAPYVIALSVQLVAACLVWFIARRWACYKSERIGDHWRSQRPRPVPPPEPSRPERVAS